MYWCRETFEMMVFTPPGDLLVGLPAELLILNSFTIFNPSYIIEICIEIEELKKIDVRRNLDYVKNMS